jgi:hypothetical protein
MDTLTVGSKGHAVGELQGRLNKHGYRLTVDGDFGLATAAAVVEAKHALGYPAKQCRPVAGDRFFRLLARTQKKSLLWHARTHKRRIAPSRSAVIRGKVVAFAKWGVVHTALIHYAEIRPIPHVQPGRTPALPFTTDCSGFVTMAYQWAGAPDPNAKDFNGQGFTGTLLRAAKRIVDVPFARAGDPIVYGPDTGWHTAIVIEGGVDPLTVSHGQESEPAYVRVSQDGRMPQRICQSL